MPSAYWSLDAVIGDQALFEAFLRTLGLPAGWQRRLVRTFGNDKLLREAMEALRRGGQAPASIDPDLVEIARARDIDQLAAEIADRMEEGGLPPNRGRSPLEVALRLIEKVEAAGLSAAATSTVEAPTPRPIMFRIR